MAALRHFVGGCYRGARSDVAGKNPHVRAKRPAQMRVDIGALADFLRRRHPAHTVACVEAETGVPMRTVERWLAAVPSEPRLSHFMALLGAYGPELIAACASNEPAWLAIAVREERMRALDQRAAVLAREIAQSRIELNHFRGGRDADSPANGGSVLVGRDRAYLPAAC